jgi:membrane protease YdiL (CAAX protease family)
MPCVRSFNRKSSTVGRYERATMTEDTFPLIASRSRSPLRFFCFVFALSLPFWLAGTLTSLQLLPALPVSALAFLCPVTAAAILVSRENTSGGVKELLKRAFDFRRIKAKIWYVPIILLMPCIMVLSYSVIRLMGVPIPAPPFSPRTILALFMVFFIGAVGEELGWSGYAINPLQQRFGALWGALLLGVVWAVWHYVPLLEAHRSLAFIAWWSLGTVATRVIIVWLSNNTGKSVFVAALFHTMVNLTWQVFPINGSYYHPQVTSLITAIVAVVVVFVWGPRTLARYSTLSKKRRA